MSVFSYIDAIVPMLLLGIIFWGLSVVKKDVSIVDSLWSLFFLAASLFIFLDINAESLRAKIILILVSIWAIRLSLYITIRHWGQPEDHRYQTIIDLSDSLYLLKNGCTKEIKDLKELEDYNYLNEGQLI